MALAPFLRVRKQSIGVSFALLAMRLVVGLAFALHGWGKITHPFGWMGPESTMPGIFQALAALSEFGGGIAWMVGLLVPLASLGIGSTMAVALYTHIVKNGDPFVGGSPNYELAAVFFTISLVMLLGGPGKISLDRMLFGGEP
jgi:putative oxidoreductase